MDMGKVLFLFHTIIPNFEANGKYESKTAVSRSHRAISASKTTDSPQRTIHLCQLPDGKFRSSRETAQSLFQLPLLTSRRRPGSRRSTQYLPGSHEASDSLPRTEIKLRDRASVHTVRKSYSKSGSPKRQHRSSH